MGVREWLGAAWRWLNEPVPAASAVSAPAAVRESVGLTPTVGYEPDANLTAEQGGSRYYRRLTARVDRDLPTLTDEQAREIAVNLYQFNALAKRVVELLRDYILGEGVIVTFERETEDKAADAPPPPEQTVIDEFWSGPVNRLDRRLDDYVLELSLFGEQCWTVMPNPVNGAIALGYIDSASISKIIMDRQRPQEAAQVELKSPTGSGDGPRYKVIRPDLEPGSPTYGRLVGVRTNEDGTLRDTFQRHQDGPQEPFAGACFYWAINKPISATRGRSDLLAIADIADAIDKIQMGEIDRQELLKSFVWDVTLTGLSDLEINAYAAGQAAPKPGSVRFHNDKVAWAAVSPDLQSYDTARALDTLNGYVATGAGIPKTWLNETETANRATAAEISEPAFKRLTKRQGLVREMIVDVVTYVLDTAETAGMIDKRPATKSGIPEAWPLTVQLPELRPKDLTSGTKALADGANALATLRADGVIDEQVHQDAALMLLNTSIGLEVDVEAMRERLMIEKAEREKEQAEMFALAGQMPPGETAPPANGNGKAPAGRMAVVARGGER